jgi:hypothetical protein
VHGQGFSHSPLHFVAVMCGKREGIWIAQSEPFRDFDGGTILNDSQ